MRKTDGLNGVTISGEVNRLAGDKTEACEGISIGFEQEVLIVVSVTVLAIVVWCLKCDDNAVFYLACDPDVRTPQLTFFFSLDVVRALTELDFCSSLDLGSDRCRGASNLLSLVSC